MSPSYDHKFSPCNYKQQVRRHFKTYERLASHRKISLDLAFIDDSCLAKVYSDGCKMCFYTLALPLYLPDSICSTVNKTAFPSSPTCLSVCFQYGFPFFQWFIIYLPSLNYIGVNLFQNWPVRAPPSWHLCPCDMPLSLVLVLSTSLLSGTTRYVGLILYLPCPISGITHFSRKPWVLLLRSGSRNQNLGI